MLINENLWEIGQTDLTFKAYLKPKQAIKKQITLINYFLYINKIRPLKKGSLNNRIKKATIKENLVD